MLTMISELSGYVGQLIAALVALGLVAICIYSVTSIAATAYFSARLKFEEKFGKLKREYDNGL